MDIIKNGKKSNHLSRMKKMAINADTLIIVSPFVSEDITRLIEEMATIKNITLFTTLQKYDDIAKKVIALYKFYEFCRQKDIDLIIKIDDNLHGKVYLFYDGIKEKGFILTSGNFTENGLINNHEYGLCIEDAGKQKEMAGILMSVNTYDLSYMQLYEIYDEALKFINKHLVVQQDSFKVHKLINKKPSTTQNGSRKYYIKYMGTSKTPFEKSRPINEVDMIGFSKNPKRMQKGDILLIHSVGPDSIVGYYMVISDQAVKNDGGRWPWEVKAECHSLKFSANWWDYELITKELEYEFQKINPGKPITEAGGDTSLGLQSGYAQITKEFAHFVIDKISG